MEESETRKKREERLGERERAAGLGWVMSQVSYNTCMSEEITLMGRAPVFICLASHFNAGRAA
jgi:hypothetical protein